MAPNRAMTYFNREAARLTRRYDSVDFATVHRGIGPYLPKVGRWIADIGAGSGRDALALVDMGYRVIAIEPSRALRRIAEHKDPEHRVIWVDDRLPKLDNLKAKGQLFDFILCSAVIMFLSPRELKPALRAMADLLSDEGVLWLTFRPFPLQGDAPFHDHSRIDVLRASTEVGMRPVGGDLSTDLLGRDALWHAVALRKT